MDMNHRRLWNGAGMDGSHIVLCVAALALAWMNVPSAFASDRPEQQTVELLVRTQRPVARAMRILEARHGWLITYEDPRYVHESDVADVTLQTRKDLDDYEPGSAPTVLVPRPASVRIQYEISKETGQPNRPREVIKRVLDAHAANGNAGVFRLAKTGRFFHVIPAMVKGEDGQLMATISVLDTAVSLAERERTGFETLEDICRAVRDARHEQVVLGTIPMGLLVRHRSRFGASDENAREALARALDSIDGRLSWQLFYDPGIKWHVLNVHLVGEPSEK